MDQLPFPYAQREGDGARLTKAEALKALALDVGSRQPKPETGHRTPQPTLQRYQRSAARFSELTLDHIASILRKADQGDTRELSELWLRMLETDAHLHSVWTTLTAPVASARWELAPPERVQDEQSGQRAAQGCEEALTYIADLETAFLALEDAEGLGFAAAEIVWGWRSIFGVGAWVPVALEPIQSHRFAFSDTYELGLYDDGKAVGCLRESGWHVDEIKGRGRKLARLPAGKYVVHTPRSINEVPTAAGLVRPIVRWWWAKQVCARYMLMGAETFASPRYVGHVAQEAAPGVVEELHEGLERLAADGVAVARGATSIDVLDGKGEGAARTWGDLWDRLDAAMSKAVIGSTLNVEVGSTGGNRALGESQDAVTITPRQERMAAGVWRSLRRDLLTYVVQYNPQVFGAQAPVPVGRSILAEDPVEVDQLMVDSGYCRVDELRTSRGLTPLGGTAGEALIPRKEAAPSMFSASDAPEVARPDPFAASRRPWDEAESLARALTSRAASATSGR